MFSSSDTDEEPNDEDDDEEGGDQIEVETVVPYRDSESEPEQLRSVSDFKPLSGSDEGRALPGTLLRSATCGFANAGKLWSGMGESKTTHPVMTTCPIIGQAGGGAVADEQRRQLPPLQTCQIETGAENALELLVHPSLGSDPHRKGSKSQNELLKRFLTSL